MRYHNFDIWIDKGRRGRYPLRAISKGEARGVLTLNPNQAHIRDVLRRLADRETDRDSLVEFGTKLHRHLFNGDIETLFQQSYGEALAEIDTGVRLRLRIEPPEIAVIPWELLYQPTEECFLGSRVRCPVVRYLEVLQRVNTLETRLPLRLLVAIPQSVEPYPELDSDKEKAKLVEAFAGLANRVELDFLEGVVTQSRISDALQDQRYDCFHFIGHGTFHDNRGHLLLNGEGGGIEYVDEQKIADLFRDYESMKLVVLNSCKGAQVSASQPMVGMAPQLVKLGIPAVIAMQFDFLDDAATRFAREFYRSLFKGPNKGRVDFAMSHARSRLQAEFAQDPDMAAPVLFMRAPDGVLFNIVSGGMRDLPLSKAGLHTAHTVADAYNRNIDSLKETKDQADEAGIDDDIRRNREELTRLEQRIKFRNYAVGSACVSALIVFFLSFVSFLDAFGLDTKIESYTIGLGDLFAKKTFSDQIALVSISGETELYLGKKFAGDRSWRRQHARLLDKLSEAGASVVVFDMYFKERSSYDQEFISAIKKAKQHGMAVILGFRDPKEGDPKLIEELRAAASGLGVVCKGDKLGYARTMPLAIEKADERFPSLALAALMADRNAKIIEIDRQNREIVLFNPGTKATRKIGFSELTESKRTEKHCPVIGGRDSVADLIPDLSPLAVLRQASRQYPYEKIIRDTNADLLKQLKGRIVLVGVAKEYESFEVRLGEKRYGLELHADALNTALMNTPIRSMSVVGQFALMVGLALVGTFIRYWIPPQHRGWRTGLLVAVLAVYFVGTIYIYDQSRTLLNIGYHVGALMLGYWVTGKIEQRWFA